MNIPHHIAAMICEMEDVCYGEGKGSENTELMVWIGTTYPDLKKKYSWLPVFKDLQPAGGER